MEEHNDNDGATVGAYCNTTKKDTKKKNINPNSNLSDETKMIAIDQTQKETKSKSNSKSKSKKENEIALSSTELEGAISKLVAKAKTKRRRPDPTTAPNAKNAQNSLSKVIPGYVAPMSLDSSSLDAYKYRNGHTNKIGNRNASQKLNQSNNTKSKSNKNTVADDNEQCASKNFKFAKIDPLQKFTRQSNAGSSWFNFEGTPNTQSLQADIAIIRNRNYIDPKKFYKSSDFGKKNKFKNGAEHVMVQLGTVIEGSMESVSTQRLSKKQRKNTFLEEVMGDVFEHKSDYVKKKFHKMQNEKIVAAASRFKFQSKRSRKQQRKRR